jgi:hypothetical protein
VTVPAETLGPYTGTATFWGYEPGPTGEPIAKYTVQTESGPTQLAGPDLEARGFALPATPAFSGIQVTGGRIAPAGDRGAD